MTKPAVETRVSIINSVNTPLAYLVLGLLVVDGTIAGLAAALPDFRAHLVWTLIASVPLYVAVVVALAVLRPEALRGDRPWQESYADRFAIDLFQSLEGPLRNLKAAERAEAWLTVADVITAEGQAPKEYSNFCEVVAARLKKSANLSSRARNAPGPVRTEAADHLQERSEDGRVLPVQQDKRG